MYESIKNYYSRIVPHIPEEAWQALQQRLIYKEIGKGEHIIREGQRCDHVTFINKGFLRFYNIVDGKEISNGFAGENEYISEYASFLTRKPAKYFIDAIDDAELLLLEYEDMQHLYKTYPVFETFARKLAEYLFIMVSNRSHTLLAVKPEDHYRQLMAANSPLLQKIPQYMLASYMGITPEHLSRIRKKLAAKTS